MLLWVGLQILLAHILNEYCNEDEYHYCDEFMYNCYEY